MNYQARVLDLSLEDPKKEAVVDGIFTTFDKDSPNKGENTGQDLKKSKRDRRAGASLEK